MIYSVLRLLVGLATFGGGSAMLIAAAPAADDFRYVSSTGKNTNPCTLAQPCRTLQRGIAVTPAGSELHVLDSGSYGNNATIRKSMTVVGNGHTITLGTPITIDKATAEVALRRLVLNGQGVTTHGIEITSAAKVLIENSLIYGHANDGIRFVSADSTQLIVSDTTSRDNGQSGLVVSGGGTATLAVDNSRFERNGNFGVQAVGVGTVVTRSVAFGNAVGFGVLNSTMNITASTAAQNSNNGLQVSTGAQMVVESVVSHGNGGSGLQVVNGQTARISNSTFTNNGFFGVNNLGTTVTRGNNTAGGNGGGDTGGNALTAVPGAI